MYKPRATLCLSGSVYVPGNLAVESWYQGNSDVMALHEIVYIYKDPTTDALQNNTPQWCITGKITILTAIDINVTSAGGSYPVHTVSWLFERLKEAVICTMR